MSKRTDCHRTGAIIPEDYTYVFSYALSTTCDGWPVPSFRVNCELDGRTYTKDDAGKTTVTNGQHAADGRCCIVGMLHIAKARFAEHGGTGKCSVCGAAFGSGDVWQHIATGEHIHLGHSCAEKYDMLCDRTDFECAIDGLKRETAAVRLRDMAARDRAEFLAAHDGLAADLAMVHPIIADIGARFAEYGDLSLHQIALVRKIAAEIRNPALAEAHVPAPEGRVTVTGTVVSVKPRNDYDPALRMTVKVTTPAGSWLAWGSVPAGLRVARGATVEFVATLTRGRDAHFAIYKRPAKAHLVVEQVTA